MALSKASSLFHKVDQFEVRSCRLLNSYSQFGFIKAVFAAASRLGNGVFWYVLMVVLPLMQGVAGWVTALDMVIVGLTCTLIYKTLKSRLVRQRPFIAWPDIECGATPLDLYSFPSGHTMHAVSFTLVAVTAFPALLPLLLPFTLLVALSRVILGLHYPTDVLVGATLGAVLAGVTLYAEPGAWIIAHI